MPNVQISNINQGLVPNNQIANIRGSWLMLSSAAQLLQEWCTGGAFPTQLVPDYGDFLEQGLTD